MIDSACAIVSQSEGTSVVSSFTLPDPLNMMYRAESDHSLAESDDNVMEGGVTLRRETEKKIPVGFSFPFLVVVVVVVVVIHTGFFKAPE